MKKLDLVLVIVIIFGGFLVSKLLPRRLTANIQENVLNLGSTSTPEKNEAAPAATLGLKEQLLTKSPELKLTEDNSTELGIATLQNESIGQEQLHQTMGNSYVEARRIDIDFSELRDNFESKTAFEFPLPSGKTAQFIPLEKELNKEGWETFTARVASEDKADALDLLSIDLYYGTIYGSLRLKDKLYEIKKGDLGSVILEVSPNSRID